MGRRIIKPNRFRQAITIALVILTCQCNSFLKTSRPSSIKSIKNELANVSIYKATMDHKDMTSWNLDDGYLDLPDPSIITAETPYKDNIHLGEEMKVDDCENFMKMVKK